MSEEVITIMSQIKQIHPCPGDILLITGEITQRDGFAIDLLSAFQQAKEQGIENFERILVIHGPSDLDLTQLSESDMNTAGWYRKEEK